jgi:hypothetical protein
MVTPGHMACGAVTAMRSLSSALRYRHHQDDATRHYPGGRGCRDGHAGYRSGHPGHGHAARERASVWRSDPSRGGRGRGRHRVRPDRTRGIRGYPQPVPVVFAGAGPKEAGQPPAARGGLAPARPRTAPRGCAARGQWSRRTSGDPFGPTAGAGSDDGVLAGRAAWPAPGGPRPREPGRHRGLRPPPRRGSW